MSPWQTSHYWDNALSCLKSGLFGGKGGSANSLEVEGCSVHLRVLLIRRSDIRRERSACGADLKQEYPSNQKKPNERRIEYNFNHIMKEL